MPSRADGTARQKPGIRVLETSACCCFPLFFLRYPSPASSPHGAGFPLAFICLIPLFVVVHRAGWAAVPLYGLFFGYVSYALFNYWLGRSIPSPSWWCLRFMPPIS